MKSRILLKDIPARKFHSVIFTSYSINLYFLEQQVVPLLGGKGITYISILADSEMVSNQMNAFAQLSQTRKRTYSIHGIKSRGAFHPKLIFLAGYNDIMVLVGSGNLTTSGHGNNLEIWHAIYVERSDDPKLSLLLRAWDYISTLHDDLGETSLLKLRTIKENCSLLNVPYTHDHAYCEMDKFTNISLHTNHVNNSIFKQLCDRIGSEKVKSITVMSPYYDVGGEFLLQMNTQFQPTQINVLLQNNFGAPPVTLSPPTNMRFYNWKEVFSQDFPQQYFHAKNIIISTETSDYLISGSTNASIAAFGNQKAHGRNEEACVIYQNRKRDYHQQFGIKFPKTAKQIKEFKGAQLAEEPHAGGKHLCFIKSAERIIDRFFILLESANNIDGSELRIYDQAGKSLHSEARPYPAGSSTIEFCMANYSSALYAEVFKDGTSVSNRQFIIDTIGFDGTNPSKKNRDLNNLRKLIELGNFSTSRIMDYLNTIYSEKAAKIGEQKLASAESDQHEESDHNDDILYLSYEEIQNRAQHISLNIPVIAYTHYKGVKLWDSIFAYLVESRENELLDRIDEEETEDLNNSTGRVTKDIQKSRVKRTPTGDVERLRRKTERFLDRYLNTVTAKVNETSPEQPSPIDIAMYLIVLELLLHSVAKRENEKSHYVNVIPMQFNPETFSWSEYVLKATAALTMWCTKSQGFIKASNPEYIRKFSEYLNSAYYASLSAIAIYRVFNATNHHIKSDMWYELSLLNVHHTFMTTTIPTFDQESFLKFIPKAVIEEIGEGRLIDELKLCDSSLRKHKNLIDIGRSRYYFQPEHGYAYIDRSIPTQKPVMHKLFHVGFDWHANTGNYWNGCYYDPKAQRWIRAKGSIED